MHHMLWHYWLQTCSSDMWTQNRKYVLLNPQIYKWVWTFLIYLSSLRRVLLTVKYYLLQIQIHSHPINIYPLLMLHCIQIRTKRERSQSWSQPLHSDSCLQLTDAAVHQDVLPPFNLFWKPRHGSLKRVFSAILSQILNTTLRENYFTHCCPQKTIWYHLWQHVWCTATAATEED